MQYIKLRTYAKINLSLEVIRRRENGYHDIESLMQSVDMYDGMIVAIGKLADCEGYTSTETTIGKLKVILYMNSANLPPTADNLAVRGIKSYLSAIEGFDLEGEISVLIDKKLPIAAGIAGGSGNAAGAMLGLNALLDNPLSLEELMEAGCKAGADVPFSLMMNAAMNRELLTDLEGVENAGFAAEVSGIGEIVKVTEPIERTVIIANPGVAVSTKEVYEAIDSLPEEMRKPKGLWNNIMEGYTLEAYPEAKALKEVMNSLNAEHVLMSGSGPTMVAYYTAGETASIDLSTLKGIISQHNRTWRVWLTETGKEPYHDGFPAEGAETT